MQVKGSYIESGKMHWEGVWDLDGYIHRYRWKFHGRA